MSCPDWSALVAQRDADPGVSAPSDTSDTESSDWTAARRHLAECSRCRPEALAADPLLAFVRLPARSVSSDEIASMQADVAALVRASRVGQAVPFPSHASPSDAAPARRRAVVRFAAALGACTLLAFSGAPGRHATEADRLADLAGPAGVLSEALWRPAFAVEDRTSAQSAVELLDRPGARVYELPQADMAVVMIVDASLDV